METKSKTGKITLNRAVQLICTGKYQKRTVYSDKRKIGRRIKIAGIYASPEQIKKILTLPKVTDTKNTLLSEGYSSYDGGLSIGIDCDLVKEAEVDPIEHEIKLIGEIYSASKERADWEADRMIKDKEARLKSKKAHKQAKEEMKLREKKRKEQEGKARKKQKKRRIKTISTLLDDIRRNSHFEARPHETQLNRYKYEHKIVDLTHSIEHYLNSIKHH